MATEIKGTTVYTVKLFKKVNRFNLTKNKFIITLAIILDILLFLLGVYLLILGGTAETFSNVFLIFFLSLFLPCFLFFMPNLAAKYSKNLVGIENKFTFTDENITVESVGATMNSQTKMKYELFHKVYETSDCFYLYLTKLQLFPLEKGDISLGTASDLRNLLVSRIPNGKYIKKY